MTSKQFEKFFNKALAEYVIPVQCIELELDFVTADLALKLSLN